jgi:hypothetical protein
MTSNTYEAALNKAKADLIAAIKERDRWNLEIGRLTQLVKSLAVATGVPSAASDGSSSSPVGFTELVLAVVTRSPNALSAQDVKDALRVFGYDLSAYSNALAYIHQTLKRLAAQKKIVNLGNGTYRRTALYETLLNVRVQDFKPKLGFHKLPGKK